jgi:hypothetical protein
MEMASLRDSELRTEKPKTAFGDDYDRLQRSRIPIEKRTRRRSTPEESNMNYQNGCTKRQIEARRPREG